MYSNVDVNLIYLINWLTMMALRPRAPVLRSIARWAIAFNAPGVITRFTYTASETPLSAHQ